MVIVMIWTALHEIRTKSVWTCPHKIKFDLTFTKNDLTLVEIYATIINFGSDTCQIKVVIVQVNIKSSCHMSDCYVMLWDGISDNT